MLAAEVYWTMPGEGTVSGRSEGVEGVISKAQTIVRYEMTFTVTHILVGQEGVALSLHNIAHHWRKSVRPGLGHGAQSQRRKDSRHRYLHVGYGDGEFLLCSRLTHIEAELTSKTHPRNYEKQDQQESFGTCWYAHFLRALRSEAAG